MGAESTIISQIEQRPKPQYILSAGPMKATKGNQGREKVKNQFIIDTIRVDDENKLRIICKHCKEEIMRVKIYNASRADDHLQRKCAKVPLNIRQVLPSFSVS